MKITRVQKSPSKRGRKSKITRDQVLKVALRLFAKRGFSNASFQEIADSCAVSQPAILYHFPSKSILIEEVIKMVVLHNHTVVSAAFETRDDALVRLRKHFHTNLEWAMKSRDESQIILLLYYLASYEAPFSILYKKILLTARARISEWIAAGIREQLFYSKLEIEETSRQLHDSLLGGIVNLLSSGGGKRESELLHQSWEILFSKLLRIR